jgi:AraC-like DNA-binding protein
MDELDALVRGAVIGVTVLSAAVFFRATFRTALAPIGGMYLAGTIGYTLWGRLAELSLPPWARLIVGVLALSTPFFLWAMARLIFEDEFSLRPVHWLLLFIIIAAGVGQAVTPDTRLHLLKAGLGLGFRFLSLALIFHMFWLIWRGRPLDLVEKRVRLRVFFIVSAGVVAMFVLLSALLYGPAPLRPGPVKLGEAIAFLVFGLVLSAALMRPDEELLPFGAMAAAGPQEPGNSASSSAIAERDPDAHLLVRLDALMRQQEIWREAGLTIGGLAARAAIPEYRLRRLINRNLGFRNFTAFLNEYRLSAAAVRIADPNQSRVPILTIALELGWGSIGPFNRAFRARFGMTPSDYRRQQSAAAAQ